MSTARHHAEWLSLTEISGPFLSMPVLSKAFPQGLDKHDPDHARLLRQAFEEWDENQSNGRPEAMVNVLIHADYRGQGGVVIEKHRDRFELSNPGTLLLPV